MVAMVASSAQQILRSGLLLSSGVGKTELSRTLAEFLFGDEDALIQLDMSEYDDPEIGGARPLDEQPDVRGLAWMPPAGYTGGVALDRQSRTGQVDPRATRTGTPDAFSAGSRPAAPALVAQ